MAVIYVYGGYKGMWRLYWTTALLELLGAAKNPPICTPLPYMVITFDPIMQFKIFLDEEGLYMFLPFVSEQSNMKILARGTH